jgi:hypothetical protein
MRRGLFCADYPHGAFAASGAGLPCCGGEQPKVVRALAKTSRAVETGRFGRVYPIEGNRLRRGLVRPDREIRLLPRPAERAVTTASLPGR